MSKFTPEQLAQIAEMLNATGDDAPSVDTGDDAPTGKAKGYRSLGFIFEGTGDVPSEGDIVEVPTRSGKVHHVQLLAQVDPSEYIDTDPESWYFTGRKLKRGE